MAGGGKGGGGGGSGVYDYYGTIAGLVCNGPVDELVSVIVDGKEAWPGAITWAVGLTVTTGQVYSFGGRNWQALINHTTSTINQPPHGTYWTPYSISRGVADYTDLTVTGYGSLRIYWGTSTQTQDPKLATAGNDAGEDHPAYKGKCYIVLKDFLFGRERTSAPNVEVIVNRKPNQSIISGTYMPLQDQQANLIGALLEVASDPINGLGIAAADIDATTFNGIASLLATKPEAWYASPLLTNQTTLKSFATDIALLADAHVLLNPTSGKLEATMFEHGTAPIAYSTLTTNDLAADQIPVIDAQSWQEVPTGAVVVFNDRERSYKQTSDKVDDLRAFQILGENRRENLTRDLITRRAQALSHASEYLRRYGRPQMEARVSVRREKARGLLPGQWIQLDIDLEPNGTQALQFFKIIEMTVPKRGPIEFVLDAEETLAPVPYTPAEVIGNVPILGGATAIPNYRIFEASFALAGGDSRIGCLAERPNLITVGFQLSYNNASTGTFQNLGIHDGFATRATLLADYASTATGALQITVPAQADTTILSQSLSGIQATDDSLLAIVFKIASGQIDTDAAGLVHWEVMSVSNIALVSGSNYDLTVIRGRQGTSGHSFVVASTEVWLINRSSLSFFFHREFDQIKLNKSQSLTPDTAYFIPQPFTAYDTLDIDTLTPTGFVFNATAPALPVITLTSPGWSSQTFAYGSLPTTITIEGTATDLSGNLAEVQVSYRQNGGAEVTIYRSFTGRSSHAFSIGKTITNAVPESGTYQFIIRAISTSGLKGETVLTAIIQQASVKLPQPPLTNFMSSTAAPTPYGDGTSYANLKYVGYIYSNSTVDRNYWNYFQIYWYVPSLRAIGGTIELAVTGTGVTTAPTSGWITTSNTATACFTANSLYPFGSGQPVGTINALYPSNAPFKLWVKATAPSNTDSDPFWIIFQ